MLSKSLQKTVLDLTQPHDKIISSILIELKKGNFRDWSTWCALIECHQIFNWSWNDISEEIEKIVTHTILQCKQAIQKNHSASMVLLAGMYRRGLGCTKNYTDAVNLLQQAIDLGDANAMYYRAYMHTRGLSSKINHAEAIKLLQQAIELGNTNAMSYRAYMHTWGLGCKINYAEAIKLLQKAIDRGNSMAMVHRAYMYTHGLGCKINHIKAIKLLRQAIGLGNSDAMCYLARVYKEGLGEKINYEKAINLLEQAIALGSAEAMYLRAYMHHNGLGAAYNEKSAARLYRVSAELGNKLSREQLSTSSRIAVFGYHEYMLEKRFNEVPSILLKAGLLDELLEFDLVFTEAESASTILVSVTGDLIRKHDSSKLMRVLLALDDIEKNRGIIFPANFKLQLISKINFSEVNCEKFKKLAEILVDEWTKEGEHVVKTVAGLLSQLFQSKKWGELIHIDFKTFKKLSALILLKAIYGNDVDINVSFDPTLEHIDFLARYHNCSLSIDIDTLFKDVLKAPGALYIAPSSVQSVAPHNISFFNSSITNGESTKSSVTTETFRHR